MTRDAALLDVDGVLLDSAEAVRATLAAVTTCALGHRVTLEDLTGARRAGSRLERLNVLAERAVFVGDSPTDMTAARAAGVVALGATGGLAPRRRAHHRGLQRIHSVLGHPGRVFVPQERHVDRLGRRRRRCGSEWGSTQTLSSGWKKLDPFRS